MSALHGDNVVTKSDQAPWYEGPALLSHLEEVYIAGDRNLVDVRFPVQYVIRPQTHEHQDHRSYAGHRGQRSDAPRRRSGGAAGREDHPDRRDRGTEWRLWKRRFHRWRSR